MNILGLAQITAGNHLAGSGFNQPGALRPASYLSLVAVVKAKV